MNSGLWQGERVLIRNSGLVKGPKLCGRQELVSRVVL